VQKKETDKKEEFKEELIKPPAYTIDPPSFEAE